MILSITAKKWPLIDKEDWDGMPGITESSSSVSSPSVGHLKEEVVPSSFTLSESSDSSRKLSEITAEEEDVYDIDNSDRTFGSDISPPSTDGPGANTFTKQRPQSSRRRKLLKGYTKKYRGRNGYIQYLETDDESVRRIASSEAKKDARKGVAPEVTQDAKKGVAPQDNQDAKKGVAPEENQDAKRNVDPKANQDAKKDVVSTTMNLSGRLRRHFLFEYHHSIPAISVFFLYTFTHTAIYMTLHNEVLDKLVDYENGKLAYLILFAFVMAFSRFSGSLWDWVHDDTFDDYEAEMDNKLARGDWDARFFEWTKKYRSLSCFFDVISYYFCFVLAEYLLEDVLLPLYCGGLNDVIAKLPSKNNTHVTSTVMDLLTHGEKFFEDSTVTGLAYTALESVECPDSNWGEDCREIILDTCNALAQQTRDLTVEDAKYLDKKLSAFMYFKVLGDTTFPICSTEAVSVFYLACSGVGIVALLRMGFHFWRDK